MSRPRVLVVLPNAWERAALASLGDRHEFLFFEDELSEAPGLLQMLRFDVFAYLRRISERYRGERLAGVIGCGDYPGCMFSAWIANELGLPGPSARSVVLLSHKLYSRQIQARSVPEATPAFAQVGPWRKRLPDGLALPFFVKPIKGTMSVRAQMVERSEDFAEAVRWSWRELRAWAGMWPYAQMLSAYGMARASILAFIAEAPLRGVQVTVDGFVEGGAVTVMGVVDSVMYPGTQSFKRFEYPSSLPAEVQARMIEITGRFVAASGLRQTTFNVEMFYDAEADRISIIELNPRMSYQFSDLYLRVDGRSSMEVQLALATGEPVNWRAGAGPERVAASFVERRFRDAVVLRVPGPRELQALQMRFPGVHVELLCHAGDRLSAHPQDLASFRTCITNLAAPTREALLADYEVARSMLAFDYCDV